MVKPIDLTSSLSYYDDVTEELVQSDMDLLNKQVTTYVSIIYIKPHTSITSFKLYLD